MAQIGDIHETQSELKIEWKINDFLSLPEEDDIRYESKKFYSCGASWRFWIYPNGEKRTTSRGWVSLYLMRESFGAPITMDYSLGVELADGDNKITNHISTFKRKHSGYGCSKLISRSILQEKELELSASDTLTLFCTLKNSQLISVTGSLYNRLQDVSDILLGTFTEEEKTDVKLNVDDGSLRAHRMILGKRSPVFAAMFNHDTKENLTGEIAIKGLDKNTMKVILNYVYSGDIDNLKTENVLSIYAAADKYDIKDVKNMCMIFITQHISKEWVCDVIKFAELYQEDELLFLAKEYFKENAGEILETDTWKSFVKENHDLSVELLSSLVKSLLSK